MAPLVLTSHRHVRLTVDHCPGCRMVWFDALESVQLDALGWVRLLRTMEQGLARPLADPQTSRPACPLCATAFKPVRNRTRYGAFAVLECPQGHGHLHSHAGLLAERGLVRPLGLPERRALASERRPLHCLNCGGPAEADDVHCRWCGTALVVVDLPRFAQSLQVRDTAMGPSPTAPGRHVAWACRGCGAPLDPARDTACPSCGHLVVASGLPDLDPLLAATEATLAEAAARAARVRERFPSGRRTAAVADALAPVSIQHGTKPWGWAGWAPLVALAMVAMILLGLLLGLGRPSLQGMLAQRLGRDPAALWPWVVQHEALAGGDSHRRLALGVLELHLRQLNGGRWPADWRLAAWLERTPDAADIRGNWQHFVNTALEWQPASEGDEPPAGAVPSGTRLSPAAPGAWVESDGRRFGLWAPHVHNRSSEPVPVSALAATLRVTPPDGISWRCAPADAGAARWLDPGASLRLLCRTQVAPNFSGGLWTEAMHALRGGQPELVWNDLEHADGAAFDALARRFAERHGGQAAALPWRARWDALTGQRLLAAYGAGLLLGFTVFCGLARALGERRAMLGILAASLPVFAWLSRGEGAAMPLLAAAGVAAAAVAVFVYLYAFRLYRDALARRVGRR
jgi:hypothetical protein